MSLYQTVHKGTSPETGERCTLIALREMPYQLQENEAAQLNAAAWEGFGLVDLRLCDTRQVRPFSGSLTGPSLPYGPYYTIIGYSDGEVTA